MFKNNTSLIIFNSVVIAILLVMRFMAIGWLLLLLGLFLIVPVVILHTVSSTKGFYRHNMLSKKDKILLWLSFLLFIVFIIFQTDVDDKGQYSVLSNLHYRFFGGKTVYIKADNNSFYTTVLSSSTLALIIVDVILILRLKKIKAQFNNH